MALRPGATVVRAPEGASAGKPRFGKRLISGLSQALVTPRPGRRPGFLLSGFCAPGLIDSSCPMRQQMKRMAQGHQRQKEDKMQYRMRLAVMVLAGLAGRLRRRRRVRTSAVRVAGDSLSDSGTFGFKATAQGSSRQIPGSGSTMWPKRLAWLSCVPVMSHPIQANPDHVVPDLTPGRCPLHPHAVVRARINVPDGAQGGDSSPFSIRRQLSDLAAAASYGPEELLLLDGGGNDPADLMRAI